MESSPTTSPAADGVDVGDVDPDPIVQFRRWFDDAIHHDAVDEPAAVVLATTDTQGRPAARAVLLRGVDGRGFVFFTNTESRKARELAGNPHGAMVFLWSPLHRQVRVEGTVGRLDEAAEDAYFETRPWGSQVAAWASPQSDIVASRAELDARYAALEAEYSGREVPRPPFWGGYRLTHHTIELWSQRPNRMHDRLRYTREGEGWRIDRLAP